MSVELLNQTVEKREEDNDKEWQPLSGHEDYEINVNFPHDIRMTATKSIINESVDVRDYITCVLNGKRFDKHKLIAHHFIPNPHNLHVVEHINTIRTDNHIENLRWVDISEDERGYLDNKARKGRNVEYVDELPSDAIYQDFYRENEFEGIYYSKKAAKSYFDNGDRIRVIKHYFMTYNTGMGFIIYPSYLYTMIHDEHFVCKQWQKYIFNHYF